MYGGPPADSEKWSAGSRFRSGPQSLVGRRPRGRPTTGWCMLAGNVVAKRWLSATHTMQSTLPQYSQCAPETVPWLGWANYGPTVTRHYAFPIRESRQLWMHGRTAALERRGERLFSLVSPPNVANRLPPVLHHHHQLRPAADCRLFVHPRTVVFLRPAQRPNE